LISYPAIEWCRCSLQTQSYVIGRFAQSFIAPSPTVVTWSPLGPSHRHFGNKEVAHCDAGLREETGLGEPTGFDRQVWRWRKMSCL
jgi:hypothetical protein